MVNEVQLSSFEMDECFKVIMSWRSTPTLVPPCPLCHKESLEISDHSSRPHTEWYRLVCKSCGFDRFITLPLGTSPLRSES
ncbi:MAG: hypothetical protein ACKOW3_10165 [Hyphomicrobium sp.]